MADERYCVECGRPLSPSDRFCPACGAMVAEPGTYVPREDAVRVADSRPSALGNLTLMTLLWGILAAIFGAYLVLDSASLTDNVVDLMKETAYDTSRSYWDYLVSEGFGRADLESAYVLLGGMFAVSGLSALVSAHFCHRREHYTIALAACVLSSVTAAFGLVTLVAGIFVSYRISKCRGEFEF